MKFDLSLTAFLTFYSLLCGISYMSGFWSNFPIGITDVINFASTSDIIKSAIIPTIMIVLFVSFFSDAERISKHSEKSINLLDFKGLFKRKIFAVGVSVM